MREGLPHSLLSPPSRKVVHTCARHPRASRTGKWILILTPPLTALMLHCETA